MEVLSIILGTLPMLITWIFIGSTLEQIRDELRKMNGGQDE